MFYPPFLRLSRTFGHYISFWAFPTASVGVGKKWGERGEISLQGIILRERRRAAKGGGKGPHRENYPERGGEGRNRRTRIEYYIGPSLHTQHIQGEGASRAGGHA